MIARQNHVWYLDADIVEPLLPEIPICLIHYRDITAERATLVRYFTRWKRRVVALWEIARRQLGACAIVADIPITFALEDARIPICGWSISLAEKK